MPATDQPPIEPRQRWRVAYARTAEAGDDGGDPSNPRGPLSAAVEGSGLPFARSGNRPRIAIAAPLPRGMAAERELLEIVLTSRLPRVEVRAAIERALPPGHVLIDLHDVWLGEPPLPAQLAAADYRVEIGENRAAGSPSAADLLADACRRLLAAPTIPRSRAKGDRTVDYDLRPLLGGAAVVEAGPPIVLGIRTRYDAERGAGRPEEVVAALADLVGRQLTVTAITRSRLWLAAELPRG